MKGMVVFFGLVVLIAIGGAFTFAYTAFQTAQDRAYIITDNGTMLAQLAPTTDKKSREVEVKNHVSLFFNKMYAFNEYSYKDNVEGALHLINSTEGKRILSGYNQIRLHEELVKSSANVSVAVDSIWTDMNQNPYRVRAFVRQTFQAPGGSITKRLWSEMNVRSINTRSSDNIHGLLIDNLNIFDDSDLDAAGN